MSDFPTGKLIFALLAIFILFKTTFVLMWTLIAGIVLWMVNLFTSRTK